LSRSTRQSKELYQQKVLWLYNALGRPVSAVRELALEMVLANGSRDEASRVPDELYKAVRPMLSVSRGAVLALSTPIGKRGFFFDEYTRWEEAHRMGRKGEWEVVLATADQCPRISKEFLEEERESLGDRWYRQEYELAFLDSVDSVFRHDDVTAANRGDD